MRTRLLRRPIVFLHVRCSICVRCCILILLIKTVRCSIPHCTLHYCLSTPVRNYDILRLLTSLTNKSNDVIPFINPLCTSVPVAPLYSHSLCRNALSSQSSVLLSLSIHLLSQNGCLSHQVSDLPLFFVHNLGDSLKQWRTPLVWKSYVGCIIELCCVCGYQARR